MIDIATVRLRLDALTPRDAEALFRYRADERVARFQSWVPESVAEVAAFIERVRATPLGHPDSWCQLAMRSRTTDELVGDLGVHTVGVDARQTEVGFTVAPAHQRRGLGTEAVVGLLGHLFGARNQHRVFASVDPRNASSIALLRKVGMRQEAHFRQSLHWKGEWVDDLVFAILQSDWAAGS